MNKFTLFHDDGDAKIEMNFEEVGLEEVLEKVDRFLKAAGFIPKGELVYLEEETAEEEPDTIDFEERFINFTYNFEKLLLAELKNIPKDLHEKLYDLLILDNKKYER